MRKRTAVGGSSTYGKAVPLTIIVSSKASGTAVGLGSSVFCTTMGGSIHGP